MKKRIWCIFALLSTLLFLTSCNEWVQKNWHIKTLELADEYFPKYFDAIEKSLTKNNVNFEKEYSETVNSQFKCKSYIASYLISEKIKFTFKFDYDFRIPNSSIIESRFYYKTSAEEEVLNLSQSYINVIEDVTHFCSYNFLKTNGKYDEFYQEIKEEYYNEGFSQENPPTRGFYKEEKLWEETPPYRAVSLYYKNGVYDLRIEVDDYLTDINIWDK